MISHSIKDYSNFLKNRLQHATPKILTLLRASSLRPSRTMLPANDFRPPRSLRKSNTATCEWLVLPSTRPKIKLCNVQMASNHLEHSENQTLQLLKGFRRLTTSKSLTVRCASDSISLCTRKSDKVTCKWLQILPHPPNIKRYNATFKCISMASHPPEIRPAQSYMF